MMWSYLGLLPILALAVYAIYRYVQRETRGCGGGGGCCDCPARRQCESKRPPHHPPTA